MAEDAPVVRLVNRLVEEAVRTRASDIHVERQERHVPLRYRVDGVLLTRGTLPAHAHSQGISRIKIMGNKDIAERRGAPGRGPRKPPGGGGPRPAARRP